MNKVVIFTDLDGTLLDSRTYSFDDAADALYEIKNLAIPLVIVSSKTRAEIEFYRIKLNNIHPFISENGGGIFIPTDYDMNLSLPHNTMKLQNYYLIRLGTDYKILRTALNKLREEGFQIKGFGDMSVDEIMEVTGLTREEAFLCKSRDFDEPFVFSGDERDLELLKKRIKQIGLNYTEGKFLHILGNNDKGKAVKILKALYKESLGDIITIGLGDSINDYEMLMEVDIPVVIMQQDGSFNPKLTQINDAIKSKSPGPSGWQESIKRILKML